MELHQQQQFEFLLQTATERFVARMEERFRGPDTALQQLQQTVDNNALVDEFTDAVFEDFLLNNVGGYCFVLQALSRRNLGEQSAGTVESVLGRMARQLFADLLLQKSIEVLEQHSGYQSV